MFHRCRQITVGRAVALPGPSERAPTLQWSVDHRRPGPYPAQRLLGREVASRGLRLLVPWQRREAAPQATLQLLLLPELEVRGRHLVVADQVIQHKAGRRRVRGRPVAALRIYQGRQDLKGLAIRLDNLFLHSLEATCLTHRDREPLNRKGCHTHQNREPLNRKGNKVTCRTPLDREPLNRKGCRTPLDREPLNHRGIDLLITLSQRARTDHLRNQLLPVLKGPKMTIRGSFQFRHVLPGTLFLHNRLMAKLNPGLPTILPVVQAKNILTTTTQVCTWMLRHASSSQRTNIEPI